MCGIVAQFTFDGNQPDKSRIRKMLTDIRHRGPDDNGYFFQDWFGIGHCRLSILDLSQNAHQPMVDESNRYVIVYNGELYNFRKIKSDLQQLGYAFFSNSDTEVVLKSYMAWGTECLSRFLGMFAFIIVDLCRDKVFVARDQLGIKPLYFYESTNFILLASEIKCFRHFIRFEVNKDALYEQFFYRYVSGKQTIFNKIYRLPAGSYMELDRRRKSKISQYYSVLDKLLNSPKLQTDYEELESRLHESIKIHTVSDVGYNIQLSGGLDSSYITAVLAQEYKQHLDTYSVELPGYEYDETKYQKIVNEKFQTIKHNYVMNSKEMADYLRKATWHMDMPIVHTNCVFLMILCKYSRENSKVILAGEGADELFGGYGRYSIPIRNRIAFQLKLMGLKPEYLPNIWKLSGLRDLLLRDIGLDEQSNIPREFITLFADLKKRNIEYRRNVADLFPNLLYKIISSDQTSYLSSLLERQDRMSMAMSVESRVPYCNYTLFDFVNSISSSKKITPHPKMFLKKLSKKYFNNDFIFRKKIGFLLPMGEYLRDKRNFGRFLDLLTDYTFKQRGFYNLKEVAKTVDEHIKHKKDNSKCLVNLIKFEIWHRMFIDNQGNDVL